MKSSSFAGHGFQYLLICFFLYLMLGPFIEAIPFAPVILNLFLSALLILAVYTIHKTSHMIKGSIILLTVTLVLLWIGSMGLIEYSAKAASILLSLYLFSLVYSFGQFFTAVLVARLVGIEVVYLFALFLRTKLIEITSSVLNSLDLMNLSVRTMLCRMSLE